MRIWKKHREEITDKWREALLIAERFGWNIAPGKTGFIVWNNRGTKKNFDTSKKAISWIVQSVVKRNPRRRKYKARRNPKGLLLLQSLMKGKRGPKKRRRLTRGRKGNR